ncbi:MAG: dihydrofolate reductase family protein [Micromonosporaceae bacterium]|nr:dihydrofolate reductase family protein [Micromonosporaceae bacterium]
MDRLWPVTDRYSVSDEELLHLYPRQDAGRPWLRVNAVMSLDGAAAVNGRSTALSGTADKRVFSLLRATCDALLVGAGTARDEEYGPLDLGERRRALRRALNLADHPPLVLLSRTLALDPRHPMLAAAPVRPIVFTPASSPPSRRAELAAVADVIVTGETAVDLPVAITALHERGLDNILCEGGPQVLGSLIGAGLVDEACVTIAPLLVGPGPGRLSASDPAGGPTPGPLGPELPGLGRSGPGLPGLGRSGPGLPASLTLRHVLTEHDVLLLRYARDTGS